MRNLIILCVLFIFSCSSSHENERKLLYEFKWDIFKTLQLYDSNEFKLKTFYPDCTIEKYKFGNEIDNSRTEITEGKYFVKGNKMFFSVYKGRNYIDTEYYIFPYENGTFLIETDSAYIETLKFHKKYFSDKFPENLLIVNENKMFAFYSSNDIYPLDKSDKEQVYNLLK